MQTCEVLVVGGGPAGSSCARRLHAAGMDVLVIDRKAFPRDKTCAGWVTPPVLETLEIDPQDYCRERTFQPITGFRTGVIGGKSVDTNYGRVVSYGIRRCEFDHYLLEHSKAPCRLGVPVKSMERAGKGWIVNGDVEARMLVGAGGHFCPVARMLGGRDDRQKWTVGAQEIEFEVPADKLDGVRVVAEIPELYFCSDLRGYGWCFRKGNFLNIGLGRVDPDQVSHHVAEFCDFLREQGRIDVELPQRFHGHAYQLYEGRAPVLCDDGVLLVGDAAGLAYPQSGEGIRPAVESGLLAAGVILEAGGEYSNDRLAGYRDLIGQRFGPPRNGGPLAWLPAGWIAALGLQLLSTRWFNRRVVLDRWFLHRDVAALQL